MKQNKKPGAKTENQNEEEKKDFPGYPHYPKDEDVMSGEERIDEDVDNVRRGETPAGNQLRRKAAINLPPPDDEIEFVEGTEADVTEEDLDELDRDGEIDPNFHPDELDVPGAELDDDAEEIGEEDEENNYYSLGGDDKENLEENGKDTL